MFKVMTWNVENLFRPGGPWGPKTQQVYEEKLRGLAGSINDQDPDALALQEIGDPEALGDLVDLLAGDWDRRLSDHPDHRGIQVAWLSRRPIDRSEDVDVFPAPLLPVQADDQDATEHAMGRGALAIAVTSGSGREVQLINAHLKSKLLTFPGGRFQPTDEGQRARFAAYALYRRSAEAATIRAWTTGALGDLGRERPLILTGDLNDTVQAATTQLLLGPPGSEIGTPGFGRPDDGDDQRLWNLAPLMPEGNDYSRINQGRKELIDHVLVSAALIEDPDSLAVEAVIVDSLPSISSDPTLRRATPASDHAPIVAALSDL